MRSLKIAIWTSGDPVSDSCKRFTSITLAFDVVASLETSLLNTRPRAVGYSHTRAEFSGSIP